MKSQKSMKMKMMKRKISNPKFLGYCNICGCDVDANYCDLCGREADARTN